MALRGSIRLCSHPLKTLVNFKTSFCVVLSVSMVNAAQINKLGYTISSNSYTSKPSKEIIKGGVTAKSNYIVRSPVDWLTHTTNIPEPALPKAEKSPSWHSLGNQKVLAIRNKNSSKSGRVTDELSKTTNHHVSTDTSRQNFNNRQEKENLHITLLKQQKMEILKQLFVQSRILGPKYPWLTERLGRLLPHLNKMSLNRFTGILLSYQDTENHHRITQPSVQLQKEQQFDEQTHPDGANPKSKRPVTVKNIDELKLLKFKQKDPIGETNFIQDLLQTQSTAIPTTTTESDTKPTSESHPLESGMFKNFRDVPRSLIKEQKVGLVVLSIIDPIKLSHFGDFEGSKPNEVDKSSIHAEGSEETSKRIL